MKALFVFDPAQDEVRIDVVLRTWTAKGHQVLAQPGSNQPADAERAIEESDVVVILLDAATSECSAVRQLVKCAHERRRPLLAIHIHNLPGRNGIPGSIGNNRFGELEPGRFFWQLYPTHRWVIEDGFDHVEDWVDEAIQRVSAS